jgi:hypothetical protein
MMQQTVSTASMERVQDRDAFVAAPERGGIDLRYPDFAAHISDGLSALAIVRERRPGLR